MTEDVEHELTFGDVVVDGEHRSGNEAVVVNTPAKTAAEWTVPGIGTVASDNPGYPDDDPITVVVFLDTLLEAFPYYSGVKPRPLGQLHELDVKQYAFPDSRLEQVGRIGPHEIRLDAIDPSPYHARNFREADNRGFIEEIRERGHPDPYPLLRVVDDSEPAFEVINGHKRIWASHVAQLESIPCRCLYACREEAAAAWANRHLEGYDDAERAVARQRLEAALGTETAKGVIR